MNYRMCARALAVRRTRQAEARAIVRRKLILELAELNGWDLRAKSYRLEIAKHLPNGTYSEVLCAKDRKALGISGVCKFKTPGLPKSDIALELRAEMELAAQRQRRKRAPVADRPCAKKKERLQANNLADCLVDPILYHKPYKIKRKRKILEACTVEE